MSTQSAPLQRPASVASRKAIENINKVVGNLTPQVRDSIMTEALRHVGTCGEYEISRLVSKNLRIPERVIDAVVLAAWMEERTRRATLESGLLGTLDASRQAGREVWDDIRGAA